MSSYNKNDIIERTVLLLNGTVPAVGITNSNVSVKYKKTGQTSFQTLTVTTLNWIEIGNGFYTLVFSPIETDTVGTFAYNATGAGFDNLVFDQINIVDPNSDLSQQSYFQDAPVERTVYLELAGIAATTVLYSDVACQIKKSGQLGFGAKSLNIENWANLGNGFYLLKFSADDMSRVGSFVYTLSGVKFDNFAYDEFTILPAPDVTVKDKCVVKGQFLGVHGDSAANIKVSAHAVEFPARSGNRIVAGDIAFTFLDSSGKFELPLLRNATVLLEAPRAGIRHQIVIPDKPSANLIDLLPPFTIDYSS